MKFTLLAVPFSFFLLSFITFRMAWSLDLTATDSIPFYGSFQRYLTFIVSFVMLGLSFLSSWFIRHRKDQLDRSLDIIQLSCDVLKANPSIFPVVLFIGISQAVFTVIWFWFFAGTLHSGAAQGEPFHFSLLEYLK